MSFQAGIWEGSNLLEVGLADPDTRFALLCGIVFLYLSPRVACPQRFMKPISLLSKKINSYSTEIGAMYFQPENITFIEETWHCI